MQTLRKKTSPCKYRNDPGRFFGDGVQFKAKLIGILEVGEARGDRMCQEALQDLKMAIRAAGEHKQRITIHVTIDGLRLRDEKTGDSLYHHPVHKISFIAQDMTDSRAFGYIFGSPDSGHRFFGIKTDKAASQVVLAMRDLFQVVFELKKKEIELARQQIQSKSMHHHDQHQLSSLSSLKSAGTTGGQNDLSGGLGVGGSSNSAATLSMLNNMASSSTNTPSNNRLGVNIDSKGASKEISPESVADLVDLEQELSSLQRGINQMERITPNDGTVSKNSIGNDDPFGDSFSNFPALPPPEPGRSRSKTSAKSIDLSNTANVATSSLLSPSATQTRQSPVSSTGTCAIAPSLQPMDDDDSWLRELDAHNDVFDTSKTMMPGLMGMPPLASALASSVPLTSRAPLAPRESTATPPSHIYETVSCSTSSAMPTMNEITNITNTTTATNAETNSIANSSSLTDIFQTTAASADTSKVEIKSDAFTDLDPLGTGRIRPYVDKKYFFQELKNPPKKVLKDLTANSSVTSSSTSPSSLLTAVTSTSTAAAAGALNASAATAAAAVATTASLTSSTCPTASSASDLYSMAETQKIYNNNSNNTNNHLLQSSSVTVSNEILNLQDFDMISRHNPQPHSSMILTSSNINSLLTTAAAAAAATATSATTLASASSVTAATSLMSSEPIAAAAASTSSGAATSADYVMLPRDTDPFSPTRKKSDPFEEVGDIFSKLEPFEFEFNSGGGVEREEDKAKRNALNSISPARDSDIQGSHDLLSGHLQVSLPPEGGSASASGGEAAQPPSTVRSRPVPSSAIMGSSMPPLAGSVPGSLLKQQTVDVISSISNKKMPHLFGQSSRFPKRDSNSINMRRLQESDSLSETETAPEPPPRPDSAPYSEPPPLPPKKQFNEIIIRPRSGASAALGGSSSRYESVTSAMKSRTSPVSGSVDVPPIPLPSRRVGRSDGSYPGPGRPRKPGHTEDDYLAPLPATASSSLNAAGISNSPDVPPLLPPPTQISSRSRTHRQQSFNQSHTRQSHDIYENKQEILQQQQLQKQQQQQQQQQSKNSAEPALVPDITLSQLLTLGIDELSAKLNVPTSKLSTMTLVELTSYLAEFLEQSKPEPVPEVQERQSIFKVNFDQEGTFVAKFDDTFGEDFQNGPSSATSTSFEANFAQFDQVQVEPPVAGAQSGSSVPPADRYAVFREIIDQELQQKQEEADLIGDVVENTEMGVQEQETQFETNFSLTTTDLDMPSGSQDLLSGDMPEVTSSHQPTKIDTKISEVLAQATDRYAALRDLILVENLFDNTQPQAPTTQAPSLSLETASDTGRSESKSPFQGFSGFNDDEDDQDLKQLMDHSVNLDPTTQQQRLGLVDSRGFLVEPSSSALTVEDEEEEEDRRTNKDEKDDQGGVSSADSNEKEVDKDNLPIANYEQLASSNQQLEQIEEKVEKFEETPKISITQSLTTTENNFLSTGSVVSSSAMSGSKDDLEIDDLMQRAISNLSLDSRERSSPAVGSNLLQAQQQPQMGNNGSTTRKETSPIPINQMNQSKSPSNKSPSQLSPLTKPMNVLSQIIDVATRQMESEAAVSKASNESWATFDTPQHQPVVPPSDKRARPSAKALSKSNNFLNLPPPPGSTSNCSQNDSALESPCSSDPRDDGWHKHAMGGSSLSLGHHSNVGGSSTGQRRYHKKERQNTSSSSRDLSWDEDQGGGGMMGSGHIMDGYGQTKRMAGPPQSNLTAERLGYYRRHARRMNSCDEDYDYEQEFSASNRSRDPCKHKRNISRSRDNFDMDSPGWYHHHPGGPTHPPHHTWSSQDIEQVRGRSFDRSAYERTTYGPPIYDKRGVGPPLSSTSSYDRRSAGVSGGPGIGYDKRSGKYYRGEPSTRTSNAERIYSLDDFDEMLAATGKIPPHLAAMYEEMKAACCSPQMMVGGHRQRSSDYMYERDRKSFDRESLESYDGSNVPQRRRRRSYDSGGMPSDPYGSCDSRDDYHRERHYMTAEKSRSLRKSLKSLRVTGDIDYEQDSEKEYHYRDQRTRCDTRSLQRPSQLSTQGGSVLPGGTTGPLGSQSRIRKSSGSSPWDGEEPPMPGQKVSASSWKRPSSAADSERRLAESRRAAVKGQTPSGSEDDKDRRYRKKRGSRAKDLTTLSGGRYRDGPAMRSSNYDYIGDLDDDAEDYVDEEEEEEEEDRAIGDDEISPADEDKFARLEMRRHEMHNRMMDTHVRRRKDLPPPTTQMSSMAYRKNAPGPYVHRKPLPPTDGKHAAHPQDYGYDDDGEYEQTPTPRSNTSSALPTATPNTSTKFSFDVGFESDFNQTSPPPAPAGTASSCNSTPAANVSAANTPASKSSFRFSNDFSAGLEREKHYQQHSAAGSLQQYDLENRGISPQAPTAPTTQASTPKLRFDDNVKVSQFDDAFEDDFSKTSFDAFENDDQWQESLTRSAKQQIRNNKLQQRQQDLIKKSESINIFAKKVEDPFEDDDFFNSPPIPPTAGGNNEDKQDKHKGNGSGFQTQSQQQQQQPSNWDDNNTNFAKFDENM
ncbi:protein disabled isoform X2 [Musca domestica]|uniref:Protein disabled isoform X2 n=1 Tax=Musca domestica TaxID=7370 RepID=A0ABM3V3U9_MUSDO|nr:protein disabled isoform X2 [Musca domestica]